MGLPGAADSISQHNGGQVILVQAEHSETIIQLSVAQRPVAISRIDGLDYLAALSVPKVQPDRNAAPPLVATDVIQGHRTYT
jgi:hypothetical protein